MESLRSRLVSDPTSRSSELWFCRKTLPAETCCRRTWKAAWGRNRVQKAKTLWTRRKRYWKLLRCRISSGHHAQQYTALFGICWGQNKFSISACVGAGTSGFWTPWGLSVKTSEFSETRSPSLRFSIISSRSAFTFLADLKLILRTREYSTLFGKLGSTRGHWICVQESLSLTFV